MLWNGVEYFERWTKLDLENIDDIVLCQQEKRFTVNLLKEREVEKNHFKKYHYSVCPCST